MRISKYCDINSCRMITISYNLILIYLLITFFGNIATQNIGDTCIHKESKSGGKCTLEENCPRALDSLKNEIISQLCGFNDDSIICCPNTNTTEVPSSVTTIPDSENNITTISGSSTVGKKSIEKCEEYANLVAAEMCSINFNPLNIGHKVCPVTSKDFPHIAQIGYDTYIGGTKVYMCIGSLISERFVLLSAHCLNIKLYGPPKYVQLGNLDTWNVPESDQKQSINVAELIKHPDFNPGIKYNDIGLLKLAENAKFNKYVRPICLNTELHFNHDRLFAFYRFNQKYYLKQFFDMVSHKKCSEKYEINELNRRSLPNGIVNETQICAESQTLKEDKTCKLFFPLQVYHEEIYCSHSLVGVASFGKRCEFGGITPEVYTRVSYYIDWIEKNVWP